MAWKIKMYWNLPLKTKFSWTPLVFCFSFNIKNLRKYLKESDWVAHKLSKIYLFNSNLENLFTRFKNKCNLDKIFRSFVF